ncbi:unnamed protein product [Amoebophrya sp. A25]|nr:unnamed protein product [Amoebophrya sp. A25]|eukprot:GSA25T00020565001.1
MERSPQSSSASPAAHSSSSGSIMGRKNSECRSRPEGAEYTPHDDPSREQLYGDEQEDGASTFSNTGSSFTSSMIDDERQQPWHKDVGPFLRGVLNFYDAIAYRCVLSALVSDVDLDPDWSRDHPKLHDEIEQDEGALSTAAQEEAGRGAATGVSMEDGGVVPEDGVHEEESPLVSRGEQGRHDDAGVGEASSPAPDGRKRTREDHWRTDETSPSGLSTREQPSPRSQHLWWNNHNGDEEEPRLGEETPRGRQRSASADARFLWNSSCPSHGSTPSFRPRGLVSPPSPDGTSTSKGSTVSRSRAASLPPTFGQVMGERIRRSRRPSLYNQQEDREELRHLLVQQVEVSSKKESLYGQFAAISSWREEEHEEEEDHNEEDKPPEELTLKMNQTTTPEQDSTSQATASPQNVTPYSMDELFPSPFAKKNMRREVKNVNRSAPSHANRRKKTATSSGGKKERHGGGGRFFPEDALLEEQVYPGRGETAAAVGSKKNHEKVEVMNYVPKNEEDRTISKSCRQGGKPTKNTSKGNDNEATSHAAEKEQSGSSLVAATETTCAATCTTVLSSYLPTQVTSPFSAVVNVFSSMARAVVGTIAAPIVYGYQAVMRRSCDFFLPLRHRPLQDRLPVFVCSSLLAIIQTAAQAGLFGPITIAFHTVYALTCVSYYQAVTTAPGFIPHSWRVSPGVTFERKRKTGMYRLCYSEGVYKPDRSHFCRTQQRNVLRMDHYCGFMNNTIGYDNHKNFLLFLLYGSGISTWAAFAATTGGGASVPVASGGAATAMAVGAGAISPVGLALVHTTVGIAGLVSVATLPFAGFTMYLGATNRTTIEFVEGAAMLTQSVAVRLVPRERARDPDYHHAMVKNGVQVVVEKEKGFFGMMNSDGAGVDMMSYHMLSNYTNKMDTRTITKREQVEEHQNDQEEEKLIQTTNSSNTSTASCSRFMCNPAGAASSLMKNITGGASGCTMSGGSTSRGALNTQKNPERRTRHGSEDDFDSYEVESPLGDIIAEDDIIAQHTSDYRFQLPPGAIRLRQGQEHVVATSPEQDQHDEEDYYAHQDEVDDESLGVEQEGGSWLVRQNVGHEMETTKPRAPLSSTLLEGTPGAAQRQHSRGTEKSTTARATKTHDSCSSNEGHARLAALDEDHFHQERELDFLGSRMRNHDDQQQEDEDHVKREAPFASTSSLFPWRSCHYMLAYAVAAAFHARSSIESAGAATANMLQNCFWGRTLQEGSSKNNEATKRKKPENASRSTSSELVEFLRLPQSELIEAVVLCEPKAGSPNYATYHMHLHGGGMANNIHQQVGTLNMGIGNMGATAMTGTAPPPLATRSSANIYSISTFENLRVVFGDAVWEWPLPTSAKRFGMRHSDAESGTYFPLNPDLFRREYHRHQLDIDSGVVGHGAIPMLNIAASKAGAGAHQDYDARNQHDTRTWMRNDNVEQDEQVAFTPGEGEHDSGVDHHATSFRAELTQEVDDAQYDIGPSDEEMNFEGHRNQHHNYVDNSRSFEDHDLDRDDEETDESDIDYDEDVARWRAARYRRLSDDTSRLRSASH